jgi:hypothetical protein
MTSKEAPMYRFILKGFSQEKEIRRFTFEGIDTEQVRSQFVVTADLGLTRVYGIPVQELPLLCRSLLERRSGEETIRRIVFTEDDMKQLKTERVAAQEAAAIKRRAPRRPPTENAGGAWRTTASLSVRGRT